jgi:hypothetical protein
MECSFYLLLWWRSDGANTDLIPTSALIHHTDATENDSSSGILVNPVLRRTDKIVRVVGIAVPKPLPLSSFLFGGHRPCLPLFCYRHNDVSRRNAELATVHDIVNIAPNLPTGIQLVLRTPLAKPEYVAGLIPAVIPSHFKLLVLALKGVEELWPYLKIVRRHAVHSSVELLCVFIERFSHVLRELFRELLVRNEQDDLGAPF